MSHPPAQRDLKEVREFILQHNADREQQRRPREAMKLEYNYCFKLKHHLQIDTTKGNRRQQLQVSTIDLYDIVRYSSAQVAGTPLYLNCEPETPGRDAAEQQEFDDAALAMKHVLEGWAHDPNIGYMKARRAMVKLSIGARAGAMKFDIVAGGKYGYEIIPEVVDPGNLSWDGRYNHFNEWGCPYLDELVLRVPLDWVQSNPDFEHGDMVHPDDGEQSYPPKAEPRRDDQADKRKFCTLVVRWIKEDDEQFEHEVYNDLPPEQWYMACPNCGYSEHDLRDHPGYDGGTMPEAMPCPQCGKTAEGLPVSYMHRVEVEPGQTTITSGNNNRRVVFAPFSPQAGFLQDGPWPDKLTGFPYMMHISDPFPLEAYGNSQTSLNQDVQSLKNASLRLGYEQMERNRDLLIVKEDALWDSTHEPYQFDGTGDYVAFAGSYEDMKGAQHFQGSGLNPAWNTWMQALDQNLNAHRGIGQVALSPEQMKGVQVGTIARSVETGDVPLDEEIRILHEDEELGFQRIAELICGVYDVPRWTDTVGPTGESSARLFRGTDMPLLKVKVHAAPDLNQVDADQMNAIKGLQEITSPTLLRIACQRAKLPKTTTDELVKELMAKLAPPAPPMGGPPGMIPGPSGSPNMPMRPAGPPQMAMSAGPR